MDSEKTTINIPFFSKDFEKRKKKKKKKKKDGSRNSSPIYIYIFCGVFLPLYFLKRGITLSNVSSIFHHILESQIEHTGLSFFVFFLLSFCV